MTVTADLRQTTLDLIDLAQTASGYPVLVETSRTLKTTAALHVACGSIGAHTIEYNPDLVTEPGYYVAVQCGQMISFFGSPPGAHALGGRVSCRSGLARRPRTNRDRHRVGDRDGVRSRGQREHKSA